MRGAGIVAFGSPVGWRLGWTRVYKEYWQGPQISDTFEHEAPVFEAMTACARWKREEGEIEAPIGM